MAKRLWYDFGLGGGDDISTPTEEFARSGDLMARARFIVETACMPLAAAEESLYLLEPSESVFEGVEAVPLLRSSLTDYLTEWGIPYAVTSRHCRRPNYDVRGKRYFAIGFPNVAGDYEIRSRYFKGCIPLKDVSLIKMEGSPADVYGLFEGFMDFLSVATFGLETGGSPVLNPIANVDKTVKHLNGYVHIDCLLDRGNARRRTLEVLKGHYGGRVYDRSTLYSGCKDLNEYL